MPSRKQSKRTTKRKASKKQPSPIHPLLRAAIILGLVAIVLGLGFFVLVLFHYDRLAARYDISTVGRIPMESRVLDGSGTQIGYLHGEDVGTPVPLEQVSPHFLDALVAREDARFYRHNGLDHFGLARAWLRNLKEKRTVQGGSTITMQLTRITYGLTGRTMQRKLLEMALARRIEKHYSKDEILSHYVNRVFLGTGMNGIEQAAHGYFGKSAAELTLPEAAMIAGVIRAPNGFSPFRHYEAALREMRSTLARMEDEDFISREELDSLRDARPQVLPQERWMKILRQQAKISERSYILNLVEEKVADLLPSFAGIGGLTILTTFDTRLQQAAEEAVANRLAEVERLPRYPHPPLASHRDGTPKYLQAATVVVENFTGAIRALVGGRNYSDSAFNRAVQANRDMGSIFKPLVYGTAFERGLFPGTLVSDAAIAPGEIEWEREEWYPENSDGVFGEMLPASSGLIRSRNTMTVRVGEWAGIDNVLAMMDHAGLSQSDDFEPAPPVYIGTISGSVRDITSAYSVFATGGIRHEPFFIEAITDRDGIEIYRHEDTNYRVLSPGAAWLTSTILKSVLEEGGTGAELREWGFTAPAAGKTGTTDDFVDAWFVGFTSRLSGGVWVGLDQPETIMDDAYGGKIAMPIWEDIMTSAQRFGYEFTDFAMPEEVIEMELCRISGLLPKEQCATAGMTYIERVPHDLIPRDFCREH